MGLLCVSCGCGAWLWCLAVLPGCGAWLLCLAARRHPPRSHILWAPCVSPVCMSVGLLVCLLCACCVPAVGATNLALTHLHSRVLLHPATSGGWPSGGNQLSPNTPAQQGLMHRIPMVAGPLEATS